MGNCHGERTTKRMDEGKKSIDLPFPVAKLMNMKEPFPETYELDERHYIANSEFCAYPKHRNKLDKTNYVKTPVPLSFKRKGKKIHTLFLETPASSFEEDEDTSFNSEDSESYVCQIIDSEEWFSGQSRQSRQQNKQVAKTRNGTIVVNRKNP